MRAPDDDGTSNAAAGYCAALDPTAIPIFSSNTTSTGTPLDGIRVDGPDGSGGGGSDAGQGAFTLASNLGLATTSMSTLIMFQLKCDTKYASILLLPQRFQRYQPLETAAAVCPQFYFSFYRSNLSDLRAT